MLFRCAPLSSLPTPSWTFALRWLSNLAFSLRSMMQPFQNERVETNYVIAHGKKRQTCVNGLSTIATMRTPNLTTSGRSCTPSLPKGAILCMLALPGFLGLAQAASLRPRQGKDGAVTYPGEKISWTPCGNATGHLLECSTMKVPMDQFDHKNSGNKTFDLSMIRIRGHNTTECSKNILYNPGGPGASGVGSFYGLSSELISVVGEDFNIIAFDPRGINGSTPLGSCYATKSIRTGMSNIPLDNLLTDAPFMGGWAPNFAKTCAQTSGEHGKYINTPQVAADMNSILDAIGQEDMWFWGQSYGTLIGQTYAGLFPNRTARMVIDGVVDQFEWYNSTLPWKDYQDGKRVFWGFFDECVKAGEDACPLAVLSKNPDVLNKMVEDFGTKIKYNELTVYIDETHFGTVNYAYMWYTVILPSLYKSMAWQPLGIALLDAMVGNATMAFEVYGGAQSYSTGITPWEAIYFYRLNDGASGKEFWPQTNQEMIKTLEPFYVMNPFMYAANSFYWAKAHWVIPKTHSYVPKEGVKTKHPLLVMSNQYDPVCSLDSAKTALTSFADARLVTLDAYGHCTFYQESACADSYVKEYFASGALPAQDVTCKVGADQYFPPLKLDGAAVHKRGEKGLF
ncbi:alpha/beta-hydrolase [Trichoderma longibrachiatum]|uniref:Alpha/beta-hydrolase n=1 Tax=Trichoderma longibrachiatum ATCC 18648 TaxID=983965 RepID=A0A2T4C7W4_TRILO|nr:alpha/beta-hydrolase [Trichoderma longibrachiatum ATCC 18648]